MLAKVEPEQRIMVSDAAIRRVVLDETARAATSHALEAYAALVGDTPRAMKRFVMSYDVLRAVRFVEGSVVAIGPLALWTVLSMRWPLLAEHLSRHPDDVRYFGAPRDMPPRIDTALVELFVDPGEELTAVMNHSDGPLVETVIRDCCGAAAAGTAGAGGTTDGG